MATRISQSQLNKFISPEAAMAPYERAQKDKMQQSQNDAAIAQLIKGGDIKRQENEAQRAADLQDVQNLRNTVGKDAKINAGHITIDPREYSMEKSLTPGQKAADISFGKEYSDFIAQGGSKNAQKNLGLLEGVEKQLSDPNAKEPNFLEKAAQYAPDPIRTFLTPKIKAQEDAVRSAVQSSLRQTLGAQFTEKEGEGLMRRSYDPRLSPQQNLAKMKPEIEALKSQLGQKMQSARQFENTGSLVGLGAANRSQSAVPPTQISPSGAGGGVSDMSDEDLTALYNKLKGTR